MAAPDTAPNLLFGVLALQADLIDAQQFAEACTAWSARKDSPDGQQVVSRLRGPESYTLTARAALACTARVLAGQAPPGFRTPATAYGPDFVLTLEGVVRTDE